MSKASLGTQGLNSVPYTHLGLPTKTQDAPDKFLDKQPNKFLEMSMSKCYGTYWLLKIFVNLKFDLPGCPVFLFVKSGNPAHPFLSCGLWPELLPLSFCWAFMPFPPCYVPILRMELGFLLFSLGPNFKSHSTALLGTSPLELHTTGLGGYHNSQVFFLREPKPVTGPFFTGDLLLMHPFPPG